MRSLPTLTGLIALLVVPAGFAADWKKELASPIVKVVAGKMTFEELELCTAPPATKGVQANSFQVKTRSEAPHGKFISRDNFVAMTVMLKLEMLEQFGNVECKTLESPIGKADVEINFVMAQEGMQIEITNTGNGQTNRNTVRWEDLFAD